MTVANFSRLTPFTEQYRSLRIHMIPCRRDNYSFVLETGGKQALMIDSTLKEPVMDFLDTKELKLQGILLTHHHYDHVDEIDDFQKKYGCEIFCSETDSKRDEVKGRTTIIKEGELLELIGLNIKPIATPGHTKSHLSFYLKDQNLLFCGDSLFSLGCGRVLEPYENVYDDFYNSMQKIRENCNENTKIYCAHEYTEANLNFLESQGLSTEDLVDKVHKRLALEKKTVPTDFLFELRNNPFLNATSKDAFKTLRDAKDRF